MKVYYILQSENDYIAKATNSSLYITTDRSKAFEISTREKANNIISTLPNALKEKKFEIVEETSDTVNCQYTAVDMEETKKLICSLSTQLKTIKGNKEWLLEMLSRIDQEISDIIHYIEFYNFSASNGYKLCKELKDLRLKRRDIKNQLEVIDIISNHCNPLAEGKTNKAICDIENKQYTPRILKELFEEKEK